MQMFDNILLGKYATKTSSNTTTILPLNLENTSDIILPDDLETVLDVTSLCVNERDLSRKFYLYGNAKINGIIGRLELNQYDDCSDMFNRFPTNPKNFENSIDLYIVRPIDVISPSYIRKYEVIATYDNFILSKLNFSYDVFGKQSFTFTPNIYINLNDYNNPVEYTELYVYVSYKPSHSSTNRNEELFIDTFDDNFIKSKSAYTYKTYSIGDIIDIEDVYGFDTENYENKPINKSLEYIRIYFNVGGTYKPIEFYYRPLITIPVATYDETISNISLNDPNLVNKTVGKYAIVFNGSYIWKNTLKYTLDDSLTYPYMNDMHYANIDLSLQILPNMSDTNTAEIFTKHEYIREVSVSKPNSDIKYLGNQCKR